MAADEMYFYLDDTAQQKGPLPRRALLKLLESGLVSRATYVWRHGADAGATAWEQIHAYEPLAATAEMVHGYIGLGDAFPEATHAMERIGLFIRQQIP